jgi:hypothetical protein
MQELIERYARLASILEECHALAGCGKTLVVEGYGLPRRSELLSRLARFGLDQLWLRVLRRVPDHRAFVKMEESHLENLP